MTRRKRSLKLFLRPILMKNGILSEMKLLNPLSYRFKREQKKICRQRLRKSHLNLKYLILAFKNFWKRLLNVWKIAKAYHLLHQKLMSWIFLLWASNIVMSSWWLLPKSCRTITLKSWKTNRKSQICLTISTLPLFRSNTKSL